MAAQIRTVDFLPEIFQTPVNKQFLAATLDQLVQEPNYKQTQGYIGQRVGPGVEAGQNYVVEPTKSRRDYQLEPGVVSLDPVTRAYQDAITYPGILDALKMQGGIVDQADRLFESEYYTWDPFCDFDKISNYAQYYWLPAGPDAVTVAATDVPIEQTFTVTRENGVYTFSGVEGNNPTLTLVRQGKYEFNVAQNDKESVNFRVTNNGTSSWAIDYLPNPTLTLTRGNTYVFNLIQSGPYAFYFKTEESYGTTNLYTNGVVNNGAFSGLISFTVPQDAPDTLFYCNDLEFNLRGQIDIIDAQPGNGPGFWIQTEPGVDGELPWSPNISSRDVLGVSNNGIDLGTVTFNVPASNAQNFYYSMPYINYPSAGVGIVDLIVPPTVQYDQLNGIAVSEFLTQFPDGIDGITNLNNRTLVFTTQTTNVEQGGWYNTTPFDPLPTNPTNPNPPAVGAFDTVTFDQATEITDPAIQFSLWQVNYVNDVNGTPFIQLSSIQSITNLTQFVITYGTQYANTQWYKNAQGYFTQMPLLTATLPYLFYQDGTDPEIFGAIKLIDGDLNATINVNTEILGQKTYTSPNGVTFTNGLKVVFEGNIIPASYKDVEYYVQGVGSSIVLVPVESLVVPETYADTVDVPYDTTPYDSTPFDASLSQPIVPDYMTINMASPDLNPWSRSNRWFHVDVINATATYNKESPNYANIQRAKRPILEFRAGTRLFDYGTQGLSAVNIIDFTVTDALSNINGSTGYSIDGYPLQQNSLVIFAADTDDEVRNTVYQVNFITPDTVAPLIAQPVIDLVPYPTSTSKVLANQTTVCLSGTTLQGQSFYYNGTIWTPPVKPWPIPNSATQPSGTTAVAQAYYTTVLNEKLASAQQKTSVNQAPLFNVYNANGYSFGDQAIYPSTNFTGCKLLSYAIDTTNNTDEVLGIPLAYYTIENIGDVLFTNNLYTDSFVYTTQGTGVPVDVSSGFVRQYSDRTTFDLEIGWETAAIPSLARQQFQFTYTGSLLQLDVLISTDLAVTPVQIYVNNVYQLPSTYTLLVDSVTNTSVIRLNNTYNQGDLIEVLVYSNEASKQGFYEVPVNLENNPFNGNSKQFTLGNIRSHYATICENLLGLQGVINGANNTRDLGDIGIYGDQILQQSSPLTLAGYFLRSPSYDIFNAIEYNSRQYIKYKSKLLTAVTELDIDDSTTVPQILDAAILNITRSLSSASPFYWSDMLPTGTNYTTNTTVVTPITIQTFNLTQTYNFTSSNYLGLLVYINGVLLVRNVDYIVSKDAPKLTILVPLAVGDVVTINEYPTTVASWCPNTPTKMGLYPKFLPEIFVDETYIEPTVVIQGHDGSITIAFGDIRDQVLLEFEKRIYDNIKVDDNPIPLSSDESNPYFYPAQTTALLPGYFRKTPYTYAEINEIMSEDFLTWVGQNRVDYTQQFYNPSNPFTYNYSDAANRIDGAEFLQGNWRGIYRYFYDTETPNTRPWEMLGFSEMPLYWEERYGPAPYTNGNTVLWDDLEAGLVADPLAPYVLPEYIRPGLSKVIPVGSEGELLPPSECVMGLNDPLGFQKSWVAGDGGPVQASWWKSSSYPFAIMRMLALTKPAQFFSLFADRDLYRYDTTMGQYLYKQRYRLDASGLQLYGNGVSKASYINWIIDYNRQSGVDSTTTLQDALANLDVRLCYRMASFSDPKYLALFTERAGPSSTNNSLLIPATSYDLVFYKNQPFKQIIYSSIMIQVEQLENGATGYSVYGYSNVQPYFEVLVSSPVGIYQTIAAGGLEVQVPAQYTTDTAKVPYGYTFTSTTSVCDFILSYGAWLESQGLVFDNIENSYTLNWNQMAQEFLYFAAQGWTENTLININPSATKIKASQPISIVDTIASTSPENMLLDQNHQVLDVRNLVVYREGNEFSITSNIGQTINYLALRFTNYEDMVVLNNTSQYNDLIYDPITAARQIRLSLIASTTTEWDGQLDAQGFILNLNNVKEWKSYQKYTKGEIVLYKNTYWQAVVISQPQEEFNYSDWVKSDYQLIDQGLLPNLANKADQLTTAYDVYRANLTSDNDLFAFGLIGFRPRQYMEDMNLTGVAQVQVYQQFLGTKGTLRAAEIFKNANLGKESGQYSIYENWGVLAGTYGAQANKSSFEIQLDEAKLQFNPSTIQIIEPGQTSEANQTVFVNKLWKESYNITSPNILPTIYENSSAPEALPTAGYVCLDDVDVTVFNIDDPTSIDLNLDTIGIGTYIWIAKINSYNWGVYRVAGVPGQMTTLSDNLDGTSLVVFNTAHGLETGDLLIIKYFNQGVDGVYRVLDIITPTSLLISFTFTGTSQNTLTGSGLGFQLQNARVKQASDIASLPYVNQLVPGAKAWVDNDGEGHWATLQKGAPFVSETTLTPGLSTLAQYGVSVSQTTDNLAAIVGAPGANSGDGLVVAYFKNQAGEYAYNVSLSLSAANVAGFGNTVTFGNKNWAFAAATASLNGTGYAVMLHRNTNQNAYTTTQFLMPPDQNLDPIGFGTSATISLDERWLYVGAPGNNIVYAYNRVDVVDQSVTYTTDGVTVFYNYNDSIQIDYTNPGQLLVMVGATEAILGTDYSVDQNYVVFANPPVSGEKLIISRRNATQLDYTVYYNIQAGASTGPGYGAEFTITDTRGAYGVTLNNPGQAYSVGEVLTVYGIQLGGSTGPNDLYITVTNTVDGAITGFTASGSGVSGTTVFALNDTLYNATNIYSFIVTVNGQAQRPYIDYTFDTATTNLTFITVPLFGAVIDVVAPTYWQYVAPLTSSASVTGDEYGFSVGTSTDGRQIFIGAPKATADGIVQAGTVYTYDRSVIRFQVTNTSQMTYTVPGTVTDPVSVIVNNVYLLTTAQSMTGQYSVSGNTVTFTNITLNIGDIIEIETNQFSELQQSISNTPAYEAQYGYAVDSCPINCSIYAGAPFDSTYTPQAGSVDHLVNQARTYGITTSTIANPTITAGGTLRINDYVVTVPLQPLNTVAGFAAAINAANIPNVIASPTPDLVFIGDGVTKIFNIGDLYSVASSYTVVVYLDDTLQTYGVDYSYDAITQNIYFVYAPYSKAVITIVSGRLTINVQNAAAANPINKLTVLPGPTSSVLEQMGFVTYAFTQQLVSPNPCVYGQFGASISVDSSATSIVIGSPNGNVYEATTFDDGQTYFDDRSTTFYNPVPNGGVAYTYDYFPSANDSITNPGQFAFGQQVYETHVKTGDKFATSVSYVNGKLMAGAPGIPSVDSTTLSYTTVFTNPGDVPAWSTIRYQQPVVDVYALDGVFSYNGGQAIGVNVTATAGVQTYFDFFDPLQGKILGTARRNIDFIGAVDPAQYNIGSVHNNGNKWASERIGQIWWDTDTVRFIDPNQDDITYASRRWGSTFPGSRIDIYQWVESTNPPANYSGQGTPLSTISYTVSSALGSNNVFQTLYYFWVRGITTIATGAGKTLSSTGIASYIDNPRNSGLPYIAALNASTIAIYNATNLLEATNTILSIGFDRKLNDDVIHQQYQVITDGIANSFLNPNLYRKFLDSFCGVDTAGALVPDPMLSPGMQYGVQFRPRQSMFADRFVALQNYLGRANNVLKQFPISETRSFDLLNAAEPTPAADSGAWDFEVPNREVLSFQNFNIVPIGYTYLVLNDSTQDGRWTIYSVTADRTFETLHLAQVQSYDTTLYWDYINWYEPGYNYTTAPVAAVQNYGQLSSLSYTTAPVGSSVRVIANGEGKWEIYLRTGLNQITDWQRVGLEDGTIAFSAQLWDYIPPVGHFGFDTEVFDAQYFDETPQTETRYILRALNEEIYVEDLEIERNNSLILMFNYVYSEFTDPSWLIRTSYIDGVHTIRNLVPYQTYLEDNQNFVLDYFNEVKPYHVQVRKFNLKYVGDDEFQGDVTDYDLPAYWNPTLEIPQFVSPILTPYDTAITPNYSLTSDTAPNAQIWQYPSIYSEWFNNYLLSFDGAFVAVGGAGYTIPPMLTVTGGLSPSGVPAVLTAIINSQGAVVGVNVIEPGSGYITTPVITVTGGNLPANPVPWSAGATIVSNDYIISPNNNIYQALNTGVLSDVPPMSPDDTDNGTVGLRYVGTVATIVAQLGNPLVRSIKTTIKYDRYQYTTTIVDWNTTTSYTEGTQVRYINKVWVAQTTTTTGVFDPSQWAVVDPSTLSGVDRTMGLYVPTVNQPGLSLPLLIDGIDYPGVQVAAISFDLDTGFDRGPFDVAPFDNFEIAPGGYPTYDHGILDTMFSSSYLDLYLGTRKSDINVDGGAYVDRFESHAPEELVPGIEFDTMDFRVYTTPGADWTGEGHGFPSAVSNFTYSSSAPTFSFANVQPYPVTILVVDNTQGVELHLGTDYTVNWATQTITMLSSGGQIVNGDLISVNVYELGGGNQLYKNVYNGADVGNELVVPVQYGLIYEFAIFVNGVQTTDFTYSDNAGITHGTTLIEFTDTYTINDFISLVAIGETTENYSWSVPLTQYITGTTSVYTYDLTNSLEYNNPDVAIVTVNGVRARTSAGVEYIGNGTTTVFAVAQRLGIDQSTISSSDVNVYFDDILQDTADYTVNPDFNGTTIEFSTVPAVGVRIYISVSTGAQAVIDPVAATVTFDPTAGLVPTTGAIIAVTTWNDTREQRLEAQVFVGPVSTGTTVSEGYDTTLFDLGDVTGEPGTYDFGGAGIFTGDTTLGSDVITNVNTFVGIDVGDSISGAGIPPGAVIESFDELAFTININKLATATATGVTLTYGATITTNELYLGRYVTNSDRLFVSLNGRWLSPSVDFSIANAPTGIYGSQIILASGVLQPTDVVMVTQMTDSVVPEAMAFRIFQDMRGVQATYRITPNTTTFLVQSVSVDDDVIYVDDASVLTEPNFDANIWGVITINGERIMYRERDTTANTVSSLLRGTAGTGAATHAVDALVYDMGRGNLMPAEFQNYIVSDSTLANGTQTAFEAPSIYLGWQDGQPYASTLFDVGAVDGEPGSFDYGLGDPTQQVEVYVGGIRQYTGFTVTQTGPVIVQFTTAPPEGAEVTILVRRGVDWYQPGVDTPSDGVPLQQTDTAAARFLRGL